MATQLCQKCKQAHPGRACDYDEKGECAETNVVNATAAHGSAGNVNAVAKPGSPPPKGAED